jgi:CRP/FNR family transcriptional regulator
MNKQEKLALLNNMPLLKNCSKETMEMIAEDTYLRRYNQDDLVMTPDTAIHKIAIIANEGRMKIFATNSRADEHTIYLLSFGDFFNVITFLDEKKDYLHASALDDLDILYCNIDLARNWILKSVDFNKNLLRYLSHRLRMVQEFNVERTFYTIEIRLAKLIFNNIVSDNNELNLINDLSHDEIAKILGTSRAVVNRNLQKLKKDKMITIKRKQILLKDYEKMKSYIQENNFI